MSNYQSEAAEMMLVQAQAIMEAASRLDPHAFDRAVELLSDVEGKVVVSGVGTSGVIGRKVAATLTSTGTPAVFLHPSDALHGALGIVGPSDVALTVSNSGETDELLALLPYLEYRKVPLIAIVGTPHSTLAQRAESVLDASAEREACPLNLAPTSTTSVALALGDALAMCVMKARDVTPEQFALNHPSGRLGKRLTLTVNNLMRRDGRPTVAPDDNWFAVVEQISGGGLGAVTVEDESQRLLGIITDGDIRRTLQRVSSDSLGGLQAAEIMTRGPVTAPTGLLAVDALRLMEDRPSQINVLPVVDAEGTCIGLLRLHDLVRSGI